MFGTVTRVDNVGNGTTGRIEGDPPNRQSYHFVRDELVDTEFDQSLVGKRVSFNVKGSCDAIMVRLAD